LSQGVQPFLTNSVDGTVMDAYHDISALGVGHRDQRNSEIPGTDSARFPLKPLVLAQGYELLDGLMSR